MLQFFNLVDSHTKAVSKSLLTQKVDLAEMLKKGFFFMALLFFSLSLLGQNQSFVDSLHRELEKPLHDTSRIKLLLKISKYYSRFDTTKTFEYIEKAKVIAQKAKVNLEWAHIYYYEGKAYVLKGNFEKGIEYYKKALPIYLKNNRLRLAAAIYIEMGNAQFETDDYKNALDNYSKALLLFKQVGSTLGEAQCYGAMGLLYNKQGDFTKSIEYYNRVITLSPNKLDIALGYSNIMANYLSMGKYNEVLTYIDSIVPTAKEKGAYDLLSSVYVNAGDAYSGLKNYKKAHEYYQISLAYAKQLGNPIDILYPKVSLAKLHIRNNQPDSAIILLKQCAAINKDTELTEIIYKNLSEAYEKNGEPKLALTYYKKYNEVSDSTTAQLTNKKLLGIQTQWEVDKKNEQIKMLAKDKKLARQQTFIYGLSFIILLISIFCFFIHKQRQARIKHILLQTELKEAAFNIDFKNRELTNKAMHLSRQEQILTGIKEQLLNINIESQKGKEALVDILSNIDLHLKQNTMEDFEKYFIEVHPEFFNRLKQKHPELTSTELKICALLRLNLSSKEIANLTNKSLRSVENSRTIIRKKMGLSKENLYDTLSTV